MFIQYIAYCCYIQISIFTKLISVFIEDTSFCILIILLNFVNIDYKQKLLAWIYKELWVFRFIKNLSPIFDYFKEFWLSFLNENYISQLMWDAHKTLFVFPDFLGSWTSLCRSSRPEVFCEKGVLRKFTKFTGKRLYQSLFFNKVAG